MGCGVRPSNVEASTIVLMVVYIGGAIMNNVGGSMMSYAMLGYPGWLLYGTTIIYTAVFGVVAVAVGERPCGRAQRSRTNQMSYLKLAGLEAANGIAFQVAAAFVSGNSLSLLADTIMPVVLLLSVIGFPSLKFSAREVVGLSIVFVTILAQSIVNLTMLDGGPTSGNGTGDNVTTTTVGPLLNNSTTIAPHSGLSDQSNKWYWMLLLLLSLCFQGAEQVVQEQAFIEAKMKTWTCVFWFNLYTVPVYVFFPLFETLPIVSGHSNGTALGQVLVNQGNAFACFFGVPPESQVASEACAPGLATLWVLVFVVGCVIFFGVGAMLTQRFAGHGGAVHVGMLTPLGSTLTAVVFAAPTIVGTANYTPLSWFNYLWILALVVGVVVKGTPAQHSASTAELVDPLLATEADD